MAKAKKNITQTLVVNAEIHCGKAVYEAIHNPTNIKEPEVSIVQKHGYDETIMVFEKMLGKKQLLKLEYDESIPYDAQCVHTYDALEGKRFKYIKNATFTHEDMVARPMFIRNYGNKEIGLILVHMSKDNDYDAKGNIKGKIKATKFKRDIARLSYQKIVIEKCGYTVKSATLYYVNGAYEKKGRHTWSEFFVRVDVTDNVSDHKSLTNIYIDTVRGLLEKDQNVQPIDLSAENCLNMECPYYEQCMKDRGMDNSIVWKLAGLRKTRKCEMLNNGVISIADVVKAHNSGQFVLNDKQCRQVEYAQHPNKKPHINAEALKAYINDTFSGVETIVFFDFETYQFCLPKYPEMYPYEQTPFQWSAHILDVKTGEITHKEYLARKGKDPRIACVQKMMELPFGSPSIIWVAYNMGFEKGVITHLADVFPEVEDELMEIRNSFVDLMTPFQQHMIYLPAFEGSYSIKYVLPGLFPNAIGLNYHNLNDVQNGSDAQRAFLEMQEKKGIDLQILKQNMLKYCGLDTWAMVMVYGFLMELKKNRYNFALYSEDKIAEKFKVV